MQQHDYDVEIVINVFQYNNDVILKYAGPYGVRYETQKNFTDETEKLGEEEVRQLKLQGVIK